MDPGDVKKVINLSKAWNYGGDADRCGRNGTGQERWDNKIVQKYHGHYQEDALHNQGKYKWGQTCYEGKIYSNSIHGYGIMSYPNGSSFEGLYRRNNRFGPGVMTYSDSSQDVGLWIGLQLVRLALNITDTYVPHLADSSLAKAYLNKFKRLIPLVSRSKNEPHLFLEELFSSHEPKDVRNLCSRFIRNQESFFFDLINFDETYFSDEKVPVIKSIGSSEPILEQEIVSDLLTWNNEKDQMELRKFIFDHRNFEHGLSYDVHYVLGDRGKFLGMEGSIEKVCRKLFQSVCSGDNKLIGMTIMKYDLNPDVSDCLGNTAVHCAVANDNLQALRTLVDLGASMDRMNDECLTPLIICLLRYLATKEKVTNWERAFLPPLKDTDNGTLEVPQDYVLDLSCKIVLHPLKKKKKEKKKKEKKSPEKKKKKSKKDVEIPATPEPDETKELQEAQLHLIFQTISALLDYGSDPNLWELPLPPLFLSLFTLDEEVVLTLIKHGADPTARTSHEDGFLSTLHVIAAMKPSPELPKFVRILIDNGVDPNCRSNVIHWLDEKLKISVDEGCEDEGKTALQLLSMRHDFIEDEGDLLGLLYEVMVDYGSDPNLFYLGHNCLSLAILRGNIRLIARILRDDEIDPNQHLGCGMGVPLTVLILKRYKNVLPLYACQEVFDVLIKHGANPLNSVGGEPSHNAVEFCSEENKPEQTGKRVKVNKKEPHYKVIQSFLKHAHAILDRRMAAKAVEIIFVYKILFSLVHPILDKFAELLDIPETLRILQIFLNNDKILEIPEALIDLLEFVHNAQSKKLSDKGAKGKEKSVKEDYNFTQLVGDLLQKKEPFQYKNYLESELDPDEEKYKVCYNCGKKLDKNLILCPDCGLVYFCSTECNKSNMKKSTRHPCKNVFYAELAAQDMREKTILEELEEKRVRVLKNSLRSPTVKYLSNLQDQQGKSSVKVKFSLPHLSKITLTTSGKGEKKSLRGSASIHSFDNRSRRSVDRVSLLSKEVSLKVPGSSISKKSISTSKSRKTIKDAQKSDISKKTSEESKSGLATPRIRRSESPNKSETSKGSHRSMSPQEMQDSVNKTIASLPSTKKSLEQEKADAKFLKSKEYSKLMKKKIDSCDDDTCSQTNLKLRLKPHYSSQIRRGKSDKYLKQDLDLGTKSEVEFWENLKIKDKISSTKEITGKGKSDGDKTGDGKHIGRSRVEKPKRKGQKGEMESLKIKSKKKDVRRVTTTVSRAHSKATSKLGKSAISSKSSKCSSESGRSKKGSSRSGRSKKDKSIKSKDSHITFKSRSKVTGGKYPDMADPFSSTSGVKGSGNRTRRSKKDKSIKSKDSHVTYKSGSKTSGGKYPGMGDPLSSTSGVKGSGDRTKRSTDDRNYIDSVDHVGSTSGVKGSGNLTRIDDHVRFKGQASRVKDLDKAGKSKYGRKHLDLSKDGLLNSRVMSEIKGIIKTGAHGSVQLKKLKLGDKVTMTPRLLERLSSLLEDSGTAMTSATLINNQLYYKFVKYKAYSNVTDNFSYL